MAAAENDSKTVAGFSTRGPMGARTFPDLMANGVGTVAPLRDNDNGNPVASGTSLAAPQVCGTAILVKFARPSASAPEIKAILLASSETVAGTENDVGQGYLRSDRAVACATAPDSTITASIASTTTPNDHSLHVTARQAVVAIAGGGCPGTGGIPSLHPSGNPAMNSSFTLSLTYARPSTAAVLVIGANSAAIDLTALGAPTCVLRATTETLVPVAVGVTGTGSSTFAIPGHAGLARRAMHAQCLVVDPAINSLGLVVANSLLVRIGTR